MYFPPAFHTPGRELRLRFTSEGLGRDADLAERIGRQVEQALVQENFRLGPSAPALLQASLEEARASVDRERRPVNLNIRIGERIKKDKNGKGKKVEECKNQQVRAIFLISRGRLVLTRISNLKFISESSDRRHHQYSCGSERDEDALEGHTPWVRDKIRHFSSLSMPR